MGWAGVAVWLCLSHPGFYAELISLQLFVTVQCTMTMGLASEGQDQEWEVPGLTLVRREGRAWMRGLGSG